MGVSNLKSRIVPRCTKVSNLSQWIGKCFGIDIFGWLNRLTTTTDAPFLYKGWHNSDRILKNITTALQFMVDSGVKPMVVFDGTSLPAKQLTSSKRSNARMLNIRSAITKYVVNQHNSYEDMLNIIARNVASVDHNVVSNLIRALSQMNIEYIVAPYEADAQLAHMSLNGDVDIVVTHDSDLILHGCHKLAYDYDFISGEFLLLERKNLRILDDFACFNKPEMEVWWNDEIIYVDILRFCSIIAGCDYYSGIPNIGLTTALKNVVPCVLEEIRSSKMENSDQNSERDTILSLAFLEALHKIFDRNQRLLDIQKKKNAKMGDKEDEKPSIGEPVQKKQSRTGKSIIETPHESLAKIRIAESVFRHQVVYDKIQGYINKSYNGRQQPQSPLDANTSSHGDLIMKKSNNSTKYVENRVNNQPFWLYGGNSEELEIMKSYCGVPTLSMIMSSELISSGIVCPRTGLFTTRFDLNNNIDHPQLLPYMKYLQTQKCIDGSTSQIFASIQSFDIENHSGRKPIIDIESLCADDNWILNLNVEKLREITNLLSGFYRHQPNEKEWYAPFESWYNLMYAGKSVHMYHTKAIESATQPQWENEEESLEYVFDMVDRVEESRKGKRSHSEYVGNNNEEDGVDLSSSSSRKIQKIDDF